MTTTKNMHNHDIADPLLDDYVMGTLPSAEHEWMSVHTETCEICQGELPELREVLAVMPFAVDDAPMEMSSDLWNRIELSILSQVPTPSQSQSQTQRSAPTTSTSAEVVSTAEPLKTTPSLSVVPSGTSGRSSISRFTSFALAAAAVALLGLGAVLGQAFGWFSNTSTDSVQEIAIHGANGEPLDVAQLQYLPDEHVFVLKMDGMPEAPNGQVYQAWFIEGDTPISMGLINPATGEFAASGIRDNYDAFAITVEPGPMGSEGPTSDPIAVAPLHPDT